MRCELVRYPRKDKFTKYFSVICFINKNDVGFVALSLVNLSKKR